MLSQKSSYIKRCLLSMKHHISRPYKIKLIYLSFLLLTTAVLDVFGLAFILPVINTATNPDAIHKDKVLQSLYEYFGFTNTDNFLLFLVIALLIIFIAKSAYGIFVNYLQTRLVSNIALSISRDQFYKYLSLPYPLFQTINTSVITRDIVMNATSYVHWIVLSMITVFTESAIVLLIITGIAVYNIRLFAFLFLIVLPAAALVSRIIRKKSEETGIGIDTYMPLSMHAATEVINGYTDVKIAQKENYYIDKFTEYQRMYQWNSLKQTFMNLIPFRTNEIIALLGMALIIVYAFFIADHREGVIMLIGLFAAASYRIMPSLNRIINSLNFLSVNQVSIDNLDKYINYFYEALDKQTKELPVHFERDITFSHITFSFPDSDKPILNDLTFTVKKGEKVGFIGKSGSGKTTLMNILLCFYKPQKGQLLIDGTAITDAHEPAWRSKIGYVKQDIFILEGTIKQNIAFGEEKVDELRLQNAIEQASLKEFVSSLPQGVETYIGEGGSRLSGGQKQRLGIARSLYRNAEVLVFDEATSALDVNTEMEVTQAIDNLSQSNKTIFIIAHRITTLKNCDRIYELSNGSIAGIHTYKELIEKVI